MYKSFSSMLGDGLAWSMRAMNMQDVIKSLLSITLDIRRHFIRISRLPFPTVQGAILKDDDRTDEEWAVDIANLEKQFGITPNFAQSLTERAIIAEKHWALVGSESQASLQKILDDLGVPIFIKENIPQQSLYSTGGNLYNAIQYGFKSYSRGFSRLLGNGQIRTTNEFYDPINIPSTDDEWTNVFIVEGEAWQEEALLTQSQYDILVFILLKVKPVQTLAFMNVKVI